MRRSIYLENNLNIGITILNYFRERKVYKHKKFLVILYMIFRTIDRYRLCVRSELSSIFYYYCLPANSRNFLNLNSFFNFKILIKSQSIQIKKI